MHTSIRNVDILPGALQKQNRLLPVIKNAVVHISEGRFIFVGEEKEEPFFDADEIIDGRGQLLMPSLSNTHTHNAMTLFRGIGNELPLSEWLFNHIIPLEKGFNNSYVHTGVQLAMLEHLRFGVSTLNDMYIYIREESETIKDAGLRALLCDACVDFGNGEEQLKNALSFYKDCQNNNDGFIRASIALHAEYTTNPCIVEKVVRAISGTNNVLHVHVSETQQEVNECIRRNGKTPVKYFHDMGLFTNAVIAAHCVAVSDEDIDILAEDRVTVAHCPVSNLKLGSGIAPIKQMLDRGISVALGTDSAASNNNLNLWEEVKLMGILHKGINKNATAVTPAQSIAAVTNIGAQSMGFCNVGFIRENYSADLILVNMNKPHIVPSSQLAANLVYSVLGSDVTMTMVNGKVLYRDGEYFTLDKDKILYESKYTAEKIRSCVKK